MKPGREIKSSDITPPPRACEIDRVYLSSNEASTVSALLGTISPPILSMSCAKSFCFTPSEAFAVLRVLDRSNPSWLA